ncbi:hypothetical protein DUNSADRAFT_15896 [Dunaliella salina]|uniref:Uncharacterized protein n=1 Tax=Dunaliella salina TaxID=3046 RepID=A0ABQ7G4M8_DUNSA|nr:hypothetical protein DUNSADRAFT_15896 [Dunaliella salina]|eukprot:KAF5829556.1 hypothetical protein DUNSADRAFT_15896 [Dunaliella salina]
MEGSQTSSITALPSDIPKTVEHIETIADSMTDKLLASQAFEPDRTDSLREVMRTFVSERYSEGLVEELGKPNAQHAGGAKGADDIPDACKAAEELLRAHRDTLALPMLDMMQIFDHFKELRLGTPSLLAVELAWQQALAVARITHHSSKVLACHATSGLGVPVLKRIKERPARGATDIAISGLFECAFLDNVPEKDGRQICRMLARRLPPTPELRAQLLRLVVDVCRTAPLVGAVCQWSSC